MIGRNPVGRRLTSASALVLGVLACLASGLALSATPAVAAEACPNEQLRTESDISPVTGRPYSEGLTECRAYEMVSPLDKQAYSVKSVVGVGIPIAPDGNAAGFESEGAFANPENYVVNEFPLNVYRSMRGASGWTTSSPYAPANLISSPFLGAFDGVDFSPDLRSAQVACGSNAVLPAEYAVHQTVACATRRPDGTWASTPRYSVSEQTSVDANEDYLGGSTDLSRVFIQPGQALLPAEDTLRGGSAGIYEIAGMGTASPRLRLVNVDNEGKELAENLTTFEGPLLGDRRETPPVNGSDYHAISESGETVFFTATPLFTQQPVGQQQTVYARIHCAAGSSPSCKDDGNGESLETVAVSNPSPSQCTRIGCPKVCPPGEEKKLTNEREEAEAKAEAPKVKEKEAELAICHGIKPATFVGASADGSKVFFITSQQLVNADTDETSDLYEYEFNPSGNRLIQISAGNTNKEHVAGVGADVLNVLRTSSDGSHVYFVADGVLTTEPNANGEQAKPGEVNLYGYDTVTGETKFVAVTGEVGESEERERRAQTTPDGHYLVFSSAAQLAGDSNPSPALAVYRYDFQTGELTWISQAAPKFKEEREAELKSPNPNKGENAFVAPVPGAVAGAQADIGDWNRAISEDGGHIIFTTTEKLQARDVNNAADVYEWQCSAPCKHPAGEGAVAMISDGRDPNGVSVGLQESAQPSRASSGMSASGSDIFFFTATQLVGQDRDVLGDLYDARVSGGFPKPAAEPSCPPESKGGCQGEGASPPSFGSAASSLMSAGGNLTSPAGGSLGFQTAKPKPKPLTRAQQLAKALKACKGKPKKKRAACESQAKKKYGAKAKAKKSGRRGK
jgi:hypothetical protein